MDGVFAGHWLSLLPDGRAEDWLALVGRWLAPGGTLAFIDRGPDPEGEALGDPAPVDGFVTRRLSNGRAALVPQVVRTPETLADALVAAGFEAVSVTDNSSTGWYGDVTGPLVDIGEETDPAIAGRAKAAAPGFIASTMEVGIRMVAPRSLVVS